MVATAIITLGERVFALALRSENPPLFQLEGEDDWHDLGSMAWTIWSRLQPEVKAALEGIIERRLSKKSMQRELVSLELFGAKLELAIDSIAQFYFPPDWSLRRNLQGVLIDLREKIFLPLIRSKLLPVYGQDT